jgi:hypothetical protein
MSSVINKHAISTEMQLSISISLWIKCYKEQLTKDNEREGYYIIQNKGLIKGVSMIL